ncbi:flavodoxin domain-containing protein [Streptomyces sp. ACA25]|uniref:flavodoxin family protein n=1 Tax=Streptomyces sp. ACA25 TaxID=3022596 RepID=UPI0023081250|nr:flavodoxin domain-containing protein [Streptomyces sp. ACA25]MDB1086361.1 flavodoxin domain-containing protein [Streptomyces sp. ACA25]
MHAVIVYESLFGNTRRVAEAISEGVREAHPDAEVDCLRVDEADPERVAAADLLVVGGPTHMRGMTSRMSRKMGRTGEKQGTPGEPGKGPEPGAEGPGAEGPEAEGPDAEGPGVRDWFHTLPKARNGAHAAAFDTRMGSGMAGGAARGIARRLRGHGFALVADPEGFVIQDAEGPLREGEPGRAKEWGASLS